MSNAEPQPPAPERTVKIYTESLGLVGAFQLSGNEQQVDDAVPALLRSRVAAGGYTLEETATVSSVGVAHIEPGAAGHQTRAASLSGEQLLLNEKLLRRVRPPLRDYQVQRIVERLATTSIRTCGDVIGGGLLALSHARLLPGDLEVVIGLVRAVTGRDRLPIGNEPVK